MPNATSIWAFALLSVVLIATPGPSIMFILAQALRLGFPIAMRTVYGNAVGFCGQVVLVSLGAATMISQSPDRLSVMQAIGATYLVFLGARSIYRSNRSADATAEIDLTTTKRSAFRDGFIVGVTNPKSFVFFIAVLPEYVESDGLAPGFQMLIFGSVFVVMAIGIDAVWALMAGTARNWLASNDRRIQRVTVFGGFVMIALGAQLALSI